MRIHLEGMGVSGSLLAGKLWHAGVPFTWHDIELPQVAWRASTGAIYPATSTKFGPDWPCYLAWRRWHAEGFAAPWVEAATYVYCTKSPPHQGRYESVETRHGLRIAAVPSLHLNAQELVNGTRWAFSHRRRATAPRLEDVDLYIITHGFGLRLGHVYWGWTRLVELEFDKGTYGPRPSFYFRPNKFQMAYAYPVPNTPYWYAGSSILKQKTSAMRDLEAEPKFERWVGEFTRLSRGAITAITYKEPCITGWRPAARDEAWLQRQDKVLSLRPLWNSGVRHFPKQWAHVARVIGIDITREEEACL